MSMLHITMTPFNHETRLIKQVEALTSSNKKVTCHILALNDGQSANQETRGDRIFVRRFSLRTRVMPRNFIFQIFKVIEFTFLVLRYSIKNKVGVVTVHGLVQLPIAFLVMICCGAKIIYDAHELETETTSLSGFRKLLYKIIEYIFIKFVSHVFVASPSICAWYEEKYRLGDRVSVLMNVHKRASSLSSGKLHESLNIPETKKIILYQGALINGRGIEQLVDAFNTLNDSQFVLVFMGYGSFQEKIVNESLKNPSILYHPAVSQSELCDYTKSAHCGVCYVKNGSLNDDLCLPNKFFEYLFAGVPVIASHAPDMQKILEKYELGVVINQLDGKTLSSSLNEILKLRNESFEKRVFELNRDFNWDIQERRIGEVYRKLITT